MVVSSLRRIPRPNVPLENNTVPRIKEHLSGTAGRACVIIVDRLFEYQTDVANSFTDVTDFPWPTSAFVKGGTAKIPGNRGLHVVKLPCRVTGRIENFAVRDRAFTYNLRGCIMFKQPTL